MLRSSPRASVRDLRLKPQLEALGRQPTPWRRLRVAKAQQERAKTLKEMAANAVFFFRDVAEYDEKAAAKNLDRGDLARPPGRARPGSPRCRNGGRSAIHTAIMAVAEQQGVGLGKVAQPTASQSPAAPFRRPST